MVEWFWTKLPKLFKVNKRFSLAWAFSSINFKSLLISLVVKDSQKINPTPKNITHETSIKIQVTTIHSNALTSKYAIGFFQSNGSLNRKMELRISEKWKSYIRDWLMLHAPKFCKFIVNQMQTSNEIRCETKHVNSKRFV